MHSLIPRCDAGGRELLSGIFIDTSANLRILSGCDAGNGCLLDSEPAEAVVEPAGFAAELVGHEVDVRAGVFVGAPGDEAGFGHAAAATGLLTGLRDS